MDDKEIDKKRANQSKIYVEKKIQIEIKKSDQEGVEFQWNKLRNSSEKKLRVTIGNKKWKLRLK